MKTTIVPAQITSVEDKIAANLSFTQLLLLIVPVFISAGLFIFLPPFAAFRVYKVLIAGLVTILCLILAIRIRNRLVIEWLVILSRYNLRPRFYVYDKNDNSQRESPIKKSELMPLEEEPRHRFKTKPRRAFKTREVLSFENAVTDPKADFHFSVAKKGGLRVHIKEVD